MKPVIAMAPAEAEIVRGILAQHLPQGVDVMVFGSRARGCAKPMSDLDLSFLGEGPLSLTLLAALAEAFDESALPWKVDLVDRASVSDDFARIIDETAVTLDYAESGTRAAPHR